MQALRAWGLNDAYVALGQVWYPVVSLLILSCNWPVLTGLEEVPFRLPSSIMILGRFCRVAIYEPSACIARITFFTDSCGTVQESISFVVVVAPGLTPHLLSGCARLGPDPPFGSFKELV